jgi:hypothetical protein
MRIRAIGAPGRGSFQHTVRYTDLAPDRFKDFWPLARPSGRRSHSPRAWRPASYRAHCRRRVFTPSRGFRHECRYLLAAVRYWFHLVSAAGCAAPCCFDAVRLSCDCASLASRNDSLAAPAFSSRFLLIAAVLVLWW